MLRGSTNRIGSAGLKSAAIGAFATLIAPWAFGQGEKPRAEIEEAFFGLLLNFQGSHCGPAQPASSAETKFSFGAGGNLQSGVTNSSRATLELGLTRRGPRKCISVAYKYAFDEVEVCGILGCKDVTQADDQVFRLAFEVPVSDRPEGGQPAKGGRHWYFAFRGAYKRDRVQDLEGRLEAAAGIGIGFWKPWISLKLSPFMFELIGESKGDIAFEDDFEFALSPSQLFWIGNDKISFSEWFIYHQNVRNNDDWIFEGRADLTVKLASSPDLNFVLSYIYDLDNIVPLGRAKVDRRVEAKLAFTL